MDALVSTDWLADRLGTPGLVVLDASLHLPQAQRDPKGEFEACHIPGAHFLGLASLHDPASAMPGKVPDAGRLAERLASLGADPGSQIILYDDSALRSACRAWMLMHVFGIANVAVLDGGLGKWRAEDRPTESGPSQPARAELQNFNPHPAMLRDKQAMLANCSSCSEQMVDARDAERFAGTVEDTVHGLPGGHIPGACNLPFTSLLNSDGTFRGQAELRAAFESAGIDLARPIVTSCGSGVTASVLMFALHLLGVEDAALYDGSWAEWGADPATPKETGAAR